MPDNQEDMPWWAQLLSFCLMGEMLVAIVVVVWRSGLGHESFTHVLRDLPHYWIAGSVVGILVWIGVRSDEAKAKQQAEANAKALQQLTPDQDNKQ